LSRSITVLHFLPPSAYVPSPLAASPQCSNSGRDANKWHGSSRPDRLRGHHVHFESRQWARGVVRLLACAIRPITTVSQRMYSPFLHLTGRTRLTLIELLAAMRSKMRSWLSARGLTASPLVFACRDHRPANTVAGSPQSATSNGLGQHWLLYNLPSYGPARKVNRLVAVGPCAAALCRAPGRINQSDSRPSRPHRHRASFRGDGQGANSC